MSLYDYFGVTTAQELYDLVTNDDPRVDDLQNFLTYAKQELDYDTAKVFNSDALLRFVNQEQVVPGENEAWYAEDKKIEKHDNFTDGKRQLPVPDDGEHFRSVKRSAPANNESYADADNDAAEDGW